MDHHEDPFLRVLIQDWGCSILLETLYGYLNKDNRKILIDKIISYAKQEKLDLTCKVMSSIAKAIVQETYFSTKSRERPFYSGQLYHRYHNSRRQKSRPEKPVCVNDEDIGRDELTDLNDIKEFLSLCTENEITSDVIEKWNACWDLRNQERMRITADQNRMIEEWPLYTHNDSRTLIELDFKQIQPENDFDVKWNEFMCSDSLLEYYGCNIKDRYYKKRFRDLQNETNREIREMWMILLLHAILPPKTPAKRNSNGVITTTKASISDSLRRMVILTEADDEFINLDPQTVNNIFHPLIVCFKGEFILYVTANHSISFGTFKEALEVSFKTQFVLNNCQYHKQCETNLSRQDAHEIAEEVNKLTKVIACGMRDMTQNDNKEFEIITNMLNEPFKDRNSEFQLIKHLKKNELNSKLEMIFPLMFFRKKFYKSNEKCFNCLVDVINDLQTQGVSINVNGENIKVYFVLAFIIGDHLELNKALGFTSSFINNRYCRLCRKEKKEMKIDNEEDSNKLRTKENYNSDLLLNDAKKTGIVENSIFNKIQFFHVTDNVISDPMHDLYEGILTTLNHLKASYNYNRDDHPSTTEITKSHLTNRRLKMSASESQTFIKYFEKMMVNHVPINDPFMDVISLLQKICDISDRFHITENEVAELDILIKKFLKKYQEVYGESLKPKFHFLTHYISIMKTSGAIKNLSCLRFEAKHKEYKTYCKSMTSRKNISKSLAMKSSLQMAQFIHNMK
uniref:Uncharacterized protein n=2 Tax=Lutzomyia longipalpis TaxID=7200 RepID=A0A1B0CUY3_LUTLO